MAEFLTATDKRTHLCAELSETNVGESVCVMGWAQKQRDLGALIFIDLRDRSGILQLAFDDKTDADLLQGTCHSQRTSAEGTAQPECFPIRWGSGSGVFFAAQEYEGKQGYSGDQRAGGVEGEGADVIASHTLCDKRYTPDQGGQHEEQSGNRVFQAKLHRIPQVIF